jgi:hypothetical protein
MDAAIQTLKAENVSIRQNSVSHDALKALMGEDILKALEQRVTGAKRQMPATVYVDHG